MVLTKFGCGKYLNKEYAKEREAAVIDSSSLLPEEKAYYELTGYEGAPMNQDAFWIVQTNPADPVNQSSRPYDRRKNPRVGD